MSDMGITVAAIRAWREGVGLTRDQAARVLDVTASTVYRWETGRATPTGRAARKLRMLLEEQ